MEAAELRPGGEKVPPIAGVPPNCRRRRERGYACKMLLSPGCPALGFGCAEGETSLLLEGAMGLGLLFTAQEGVWVFPLFLAGLPDTEVFVGCKVGAGFQGSDPGEGGLVGRCKSKVRCLVPQRAGTGSFSRAAPRAKTLVGFGVGGCHAGFWGLGGSWAHLLLWGRLKRRKKKGTEGG